ncbi:hypothetical protein TrVE_jg9617 [Triparma verrucosa]|uniref:Kinesin light chain n=1 Tax=Triparma verrucosa TaxID=1606542 RepID=A0A9W7FFB2_9STRA|nr:hypothetical protein TrVE_jg9617 [Triparma verrucosa]
MGQCQSNPSSNSGTDDRPESLEIKIEDSISSNPNAPSSPKKEDTIKVLKGWATLGEEANAKMDYSTALHYFYMAMEGFKKIHGADSTFYIELEFLIATAKDELGRCAEALTLYQDVLSKQERIFGPDDERTLTTLNNTAWVLYENKRYEDSKAHYEKCLERKIRIFGENHNSTITTMNSLGNLYLDGFKNYPLAITYKTRALKSLSTFLGPQHPVTLSTIMNVAIITSCFTEDVMKARDLFKQALKGYEEQLGKGHNMTKTCAGNYKVFLEEHPKVKGARAELKKIKKDYP